jgi:hypothetical protein
LFSPSRLYISEEKGARPTPKLKKIAVPNHTAAFRIPTILKNPITRAG